MSGKDPAFLFYPGDYLRDTQCLSEPAQVAYDRIMCEHMRNICKDMSNIAITKARLNFFTKRLNSEDREMLMSILAPVGLKYQIEWVAASISKRAVYSESRKKNRRGKKKKDMLTYVNHMENENENEDVVNTGIENFRHDRKNEYFGPERKFLEDQGYLWTDQDGMSIQSLKKKIASIHRRENLNQDKESLLCSFKLLIENLSDWVRQNKFSLSYIDRNFNEIYQHGKQKLSTGIGGGLSQSLKDQARRHVSAVQGELPRHDTKKKV